MIKKIGIIILIALCPSLDAQSQIEDIWTGVYTIRTTEDSAVQMQDTIVIQKAPDVVSDDVTSKYRSDLSRWTLALKSDTKQKTTVRRFLTDQEHNEYEQFGWRELYEQGKMNCLESSGLMICKTNPKSNVSLPNGESFKTKSGIFGIMLHVGLAELNKISD